MAGTTFGRTVIDTLGRSIQLTADGLPKFKPGGVTVDWTGTVTAVNADTTFFDGVIALNGTKVLRYGQVLTKITNQPSQTITVGGTPTGGTFTAVGVRPDTGVTTSQTIAFNSTVAQTQTAMDNIYGSGNTLVSGAGALPGNVPTVTFQGVLIGYAPAVLTGSAALLTGGTPTLAYAVVIAGGNNGRYGPYDPAASDGRQTLTRGSCFLVNTTMRETDLLSNHPPVLDGGRIWKARVLQSGGATHTLALGPTLAEFEAAFPQISYADG
jgi:hypothetical protein